jgi:hypothetical protein
MALMELMSKPNRPPPMMEMAAMRYMFPYCFTMVGDFWWECDGSKSAKGVRSKI